MVLTLYLRILVDISPHSIPLCLPLLPAFLLTMATKASLPRQERELLSQLRDDGLLPLPAWGHEAQALVTQYNTSIEKYNRIRRAVILTIPVFTTVKLIATAASRRRRHSLKSAA